MNERGSVTFLNDENEGPTRKDLLPGTLFVYDVSATLQLYLVPNPALSRIPGVSEKDIIVGGAHSGSLDDAHLNSAVTVVNISVKRASIVPAKCSDGPSRLAVNDPSDLIAAYGRGDGK